MAVVIAAVVIVVVIVVVVVVVVVAVVAAVAVVAVVAVVVVEVVVVEEVVVVVVVVVAILVVVVVVVVVVGIEVVVVVIVVVIVEAVVVIVKAVVVIVVVVVAAVAVVAVVIVEVVVVVVVVHFDYEMCFAPQWRALFQHFIFQKCSGVGVFCTFFIIFPSKCASRQPAACNFSSLISPDGSAPAALASLTFQPSGATKHWKQHSVWRLFYLSRTCIFFLWLFLFSDLLSTDPPLLFYLSILSEV